jgi:hypothetical protein
MPTAGYGQCHVLRLVFTGTLLIWCLNVGICWRAMRAVYYWIELRCWCGTHSKHCRKLVIAFTSSDAVARNADYAFLVACMLPVYTGPCRHLAWCLLLHSCSTQTLRSVYSCHQQGCSSRPSALLYQYMCFCQRPFLSQHCAAGDHSG